MDFVISGGPGGSARLGRGGKGGRKNVVPSHCVFRSIRQHQRQAVIMEATVTNVGSGKVPYACGANLATGIEGGGEQRSAPLQTFGAAVAARDGAVETYIRRKKG